jgi:hypothetical protein
MVIEEHVPAIQAIFQRAARNRGTVGYRSIYGLFDEDQRMSDRRDTFEAACRELCPRETAIAEALFALKEDGYPKHGFYEVFKTIRGDEYKEMAGTTHPTDLTLDQRRAIADRERARVYAAIG